MPHQAATLAESFDNLVTLTRHINNLQLNHAASQPRGVASRHQGGYTIAQGGGVAPFRQACVLLIWRAVLTGVI